MNLTMGKTIKWYSGKEFPPDPNVLRRANVFSRVGPFDTSMLRGGQDLDFTRRSLREGFRIAYSPGAVVYHEVPEHRLGDEYFLWSSLRHGQSFAFMDCKAKGRVGLILLAVARISQGFLINLPAAAVATLRKSRADFLWRKCTLYRLWGYLRATAFLLAPARFGQRQFFESLEFRKEKHR